MIRLPATRRSQLITPALDFKRIEKAAALECDSLILDLEDAVAPSMKAEARAVVRRALHDLRFEGKEVGVRINALDTPWLLDDLLALEGLPLDTVVVPKVHDAIQLQVYAALLEQLERRGGHPGISLQALIESARGLENAAAIAAASSRCEALIFGVGDYIADTGVAFNPRALSYARARIAAAAAAAGVQALDHVHPDVKDDDGLAESAAQARGLGFTGKWAIHPRQVAVINEAFSPSSADIARARRVIAAYEDSLAKGVGAIVLDGELVDEASLKIARRHQAAAQRMGRWGNAT